MKEKLRVSLPIIVEGKYDKIKLESILDADIFTTGGFSLFKRDDRLGMLCRMSENGVIILTDSDGAGTLIRSHLSSAIPKDKIYQLYTPKIEGKEKRKKSPSRAGTLGVEGIDADILRSLFAPFADGRIPRREDPITKADLYNVGMSGGADSASRRARFCALASLPEDISANALLSAINVTMSREEFFELCKALDE